MRMRILLGGVVAIADCMACSGGRVGFADDAAVGFVDAGDASVGAGAPDSGDGATASATSVATTTGAGSAFWDAGGSGSPSADASVDGEGTSGGSVRDASLSDDGTWTDDPTDSSRLDAGDDLTTSTSVGSLAKDAAVAPVPSDEHAPDASATMTVERDTSTSSQSQDDELTTTGTGAASSESGGSYSTADSTGATDGGLGSEAPTSSEAHTSLDEGTPTFFTGDETASETADSGIADASEAGLSEPPEAGPTSTLVDGSTLVGSSNASESQNPSGTSALTEPVEAGVTDVAQTTAPDADDSESAPTEADASDVDSDGSATSSAAVVSASTNDSSSEASTVVTVPSTTSSRSPTSAATSTGSDSAESPSGVVSLDPLDAGSSDGGDAHLDASDQSPTDEPDGGPTADDAGADDAGQLDAGADDAGQLDAGTDDASTHDAGTDDAAQVDASAAPPAQLTSLQVIGGRYPLKPAFDPAITRYSVVATSTSERLQLTATGSESAPMSVNGQSLPDGQTVTLSEVAPGSDITLTVGDPTSTTEYSIKYLPPSFPDLVVTQSQPGASTDPLYTNVVVASGNFAVKMDNNGVPYFYKQEADRVFDFKKHPNGLMSYAVWEDPDFAGVTQILFDADYREIDRMKAVGLNNTDNHEFLILPNGNFVFLAYERAIRDLSPFGGGTAVEVKDSVFQEVSPDLQVVFQWNSWDHVSYGDSIYAFSTIDYGHANSVFVDHDDNWLVSFRGFSQILKIHRTTGEVMWRLGGLNSDFTFINDPFNGVCGQHTASRLANGHILIFDNGRDCQPEILGSRQSHTRIVEYALDEDAMTAELVWSYSRSGQYARSQGSAQRLDNGNTVIGWGQGPSLLATEVDPTGAVVFEVEARPPTGRAQCYRARRYPD